MLAVSPATSADERTSNADSESKEGKHSKFSFKGKCKPSSPAILGREGRHRLSQIHNRANDCNHLTLHGEPALSDWQHGRFGCCAAPENKPIRLLSVIFKIMSNYRRQQIFQLSTLTLHSSVWGVTLLLIFSLSLSVRSVLDMVQGHEGKAQAELSLILSNILWYKGWSPSERRGVTF